MFLYMERERERHRDIYVEREEERTLNLKNHKVFPFERRLSWQPQHHKELKAHKPSSKAHFFS
ncbi:hypothetical protein HanIR_Chr15g0769881 [Helianthus annuus]|nr:hypothetical protein HanIR_Chr15g0769881 [Helianthus annuus]